MIEQAVSEGRRADGGPDDAALPNILIVEDDPALVELFSFVFQRDGFNVTTTADGDEALSLAHACAPDVILLDWMILSLPGIEVLKQLRSSPATARIPVIMISARGEETDRIAGLASGADDYVPKPASPRELVARVKAVLRRDRSTLKTELLTFLDLEMDVTKHKVRRNGRLLGLGPKEFQLLRHLMESPKRVFERERLIDLLWGSDADIDRRTIDVHVLRLRQVINSGFEPPLIQTVRAKGYSLCATD